MLEATSPHPPDPRLKSERTGSPFCYLDPEKTSMRTRSSLLTLMIVVLVSAVLSAALRSGSEQWFRTIYTITAVSLVLATLAARFRGEFWFGFALFGWSHYLLGFGPWMAPPSSPGTADRCRVSP